MSVLDDFFGETDKRVELSRQLTTSLEERYGFHAAREILRDGSTNMMSELEKQLYTEWKPLHDDHQQDQDQPPSYNNTELPDFDFDTSANGVE